MNSYPKILDDLGRGHPVQVTRVGGGCIAHAMVARFGDGSKVFVKCLEGIPGMFECEAIGLRELASAEAIRIPKVIAVQEGVLVLDCIESAPKDRNFSESFGCSLARLHKIAGPCSGFSHDNFIGSTAQYNQPLSEFSNAFSLKGQTVGDGADWPGFFFDRRLRFQVMLATENGYGGELGALLDGGERRIKDLLNEAIETPSLLHGDLWGGNVMTDENGEACLIDPAVYYGHRESDLAMTELFGGFDATFYDAYRQHYPLTPGYEARRPLYQLYHLLNHLNLFGTTYYSRCVQILQNYSAP